MDKLKIKLISKNIENHKIYYFLKRIYIMINESSLLRYHLKLILLYIYIYFYYILLYIYIYFLKENLK